MAIDLEQSKGTNHGAWSLRGSILAIGLEG